MALKKFYQGVLNSGHATQSRGTPGDGVENRGVKSKFVIGWGEPSPLLLLSSRRNADCPAYKPHMEIRKVLQNRGKKVEIGQDKNTTLKREERKRKLWTQSTGSKSN